LLYYSYLQLDNIIFHPFATYSTTTYNLPLTQLWVSKEICSVFWFCLGRVFGFIDCRACSNYFHGLVDRPGLQKIHNHNHICWLFQAVSWHTLTGKISTVLSSVGTDFMSLFFRAMSMAGLNGHGSSSASSEHTTHLNTVQKDLFGTLVLSLATLYSVNSTIHNIWNAYQLLTRILCWLLSLVIVPFVLASCGP